MKFSSFFKLVEIQTKVASVIPFLMGTLYSVYHFRTFSLKNFIIMFTSLICLDMGTTAINNFMDYKKANKKHGYGYENHNAIVKYNMTEGTVVLIIVFLMSISAILGIILFINTNIIVLILGVISFITAVLYSFGPIPISRTPFGEVYSGGFMGVIIPFIAIYIHNFKGNLISFSLVGGSVNLGINLLELLYIILFVMPAATGIANIMLANNICDMEDDMENRRYTLPIFIGKDKSLLFFKTLYYLGYLSLIIVLILSKVPVMVVLTLITYVVVNKNIKQFYKLQTKKDTFVLAVKNFIIVNLSIVLTMLIGILIEK